MPIEISQELLSAVLGYKAYPVKKEHIRWDTNARVSDLVFEKENEIQYCIDIYNLAHKCKDWAIEKHYVLESYIAMVKSEDKAYCYIHYRFEVEDSPYFGADTEVEAVIKACEWILKEIKYKQLKEEVDEIYCNKVLSNMEKVLREEFSSNGN